LTVLKTNKVIDKKCAEAQRGLQDAMEIMNGKWKVPVLLSLSFGKRKFMDLRRELGGISAKMLSTALKDLEDHGLVSRTTLNTRPVTVEYEMTEYGLTLKKVLMEITKWGINHRRHVFGREAIDCGEGCPKSKEQQQLFSDSAPEPTSKSQA
jgi:DNA-binding HxlR family transcriptional regulator